jgi:hypothetical protein
MTANQIEAGRGYKRQRNLPFHHVVTRVRMQGQNPPGAADTGLVRSMRVGFCRSLPCCNTPILCLPLCQNQ